MGMKRVPPETREKVEDAVLLVLVAMVAILLLLVLAQKREREKSRPSWSVSPVKGSSDREDRAR
jgi:hypothetical protein